MSTPRPTTATFSRSCPPMSGTGVSVSIPCWRPGVNGSISGRKFHDGARVKVERQVAYHFDGPRDVMPCRHKDRASTGFLCRRDRSAKRVRRIGRAIVLRTIIQNVEHGQARARRGLCVRRAADTQRPRVQPQISTAIPRSLELLIVRAAHFGSMAMTDSSVSPRLWPLCVWPSRHTTSSVFSVEGWMLPSGNTCSSCAPLRQTTTRA